MVSRSKQVDDLASKLAKLGKLHADGALSDEEFRALKARLISSTSLQKRREEKQADNGNFNNTLRPTSSPFGERLFGGNFIVGSLIAINIAIFVLMLRGNPSEGWSSAYLLSWGADYGRLTLNGEFWRLFTSTFLHLNFIHIAGNMGCLFYWGSVTERALGSPVFLLVYCLCGLFASLISVLTNPQVVSVGASGAIAGVLGVMCVMWFRSDARVSTEDVLGNLAVNAVLSFVAGVDWVAHVAGLVSGLALGALALPTDSHAKRA
jgi:membrane associated rhomboid family serine protease